MKISLISLLFTCLSCTTTKTALGDAIETADFVLAFGSCNRTDLPNLLWDDILKTKPDVWVWGGDNIYADTDDMQVLSEMYSKQKQVEGYAKLVETIDIIGTWDDHDYGLNDGGVEYMAKDESQQEFLNFMNVSLDSPLRKQEGVYMSKEYVVKDGTIHVIVLDTRYFRTPLTPDTETNMRIKPNDYGVGTVLGEIQWLWLENELSNSEADFNVIVSSIQYLSNEHGFETWGNFPHEVNRLERLIVKSKAKGVIILSGDRHISEFSRTKFKGMNYPLIDFTSSGLTHAYKGFSGEPNPYRVGEVISMESFGVLEFDFSAKKVDFEIIGDNGVVLEKLEQVFE
ncbi:alkaline phosphatase D family protein [Maribacter sp. ACAM166]|uniref:alkaline phosphatase D family protein n=1 Tax=Maribacter sp. ACAM166 TaxID=2508996 RepID=UPI0010FF4112|nr:alkaline phosphatase D family protein [Maribacter sp. ACAM166]TLP80590.1 alkaline phosphatase family protein [Maribacter sp. ACAM166]